jgi:rubredoxin
MANPTCPRCADEKFVTPVWLVEENEKVTSRRWNCRSCLLVFDDEPTARHDRRQKVLRVLGTIAAVALPILWLRR